MSQRTWLVLSLLLVSTSLAHAQAPCSCKDVDDLIQRINMAHAAIDKYQLELAGGQGIKPKDTVDALPPKSSRNNRLVLQDSVNEAMGEVRRPKRTEVVADTSGVTCQPVVRIEPFSACMKALVDAHEAVHKTACEADKLQRKLGKFDDRLKGMLLSKYAQEEIKGYEVEIDEAMKRLRALPASCRPSGWVGTIYAIEVKGSTITITKPPGNQYSTGSTKKTDDDRSRWGAVYVDGANSSAYWHIKQHTERKETAGALVNCIGGLKPRPPDRQEIGTYDLVTSGTGFNTDVPSFSIDLTVDEFYYEISIQLPEVKGEYTGKSIWTTSGGCKDTTEELNVPKSYWTWHKSNSFTFGGKVVRSARYIGGSAVEDLNKGAIPIPGVERNDHKIKFTWHLHRVD
jgi:hypothetical protein